MKFDTSLQNILNTFQSKLVESAASTPLSDKEAASFRIECDDSSCGVYTYVNGKEYTGDIVSIDLSRKFETAIREALKVGDSNWQEAREILSNAIS